MEQVIEEYSTSNDALDWAYDNKETLTFGRELSEQERSDASCYIGDGKHLSDQMNSFTDGFSKGIEFVVKHLKTLLPKEKKQLEEAFNAGFNMQHVWGHKDFNDYFSSIKNK